MTQAIVMPCHDPIAIWDWLEANCPSASIEGIGVDPAARGIGRGFIQVLIPDDEERVLFYLRWTQPH